MKEWLKILKQLGRPVFFLVKSPARVRDPLIVINTTSSLSDLNSDKNKDSDYVMIGFRIKRP